MVFATAKKIADNALKPKQAGGGDVQALVKDAKENIILYPNPAKDVITVTIVGGVTGKNSLKICDMQGKALIQRQLFIQDAATSIQIPISHLSAGVYLVQLYPSHGRSAMVKKFLKQ